MLSNMMATPQTPTYLTDLSNPYAHGSYVTPNTYYGGQKNPILAAQTALNDAYGSNFGNTYLQNALLSALGGSASANTAASLLSQMGQMPSDPRTAAYSMPTAFNVVDPNTLPSGTSILQSQGVPLTMAGVIDQNGGMGQMVTGPAAKLMDQYQPYLEQIGQAAALKARTHWLGSGGAVSARSGQLGARTYADVLSATAQPTAAFLQNAQTPFLNNALTIANTNKSTADTMALNNQQALNQGRIAQQAAYNQNWMAQNQAYNQDWLNQRNAVSQNWQTQQNHAAQAAAYALQALFSPSTWGRDASGGSGGGSMAGAGWNNGKLAIGSIDPHTDSQGNPTDGSQRNPTSYTGGK